MINSLFIADSERLRQCSLHRRRHLNIERDKALINFSSNDYLSLAEDSRLKRAYQKGFATYPTSSSASMMAGGYHSIHRSLEKAFAQALGVDEAILFSSGYAANLAIMSLLARFDCQTHIDKAAHASFYDGLRLAGGRYKRFLHNNLAHLQQILEQADSKALVLTESVFSMSGQRTDLGALAGLALDKKLACIIDEAHAFGLMGPEGMGAIPDYGLDQQVIPLRVIPLGKACASQGAIVCGKGGWIDALLQSARSYIYSTGISPALAYGLIETLDIIRRADERREKLNQLIDYFRRQITQSPLRWRDSTTAIQQLQLGCSNKALNYAGQLEQQGLLCHAMRVPTVTKKETGLRIILNYQHEPEQIDFLFAELHRYHDNTH